MASASSKSAKSLFVESKTRLADRVQNNVNNIASVARQIQRGSRTSEIMMQSARAFAAQEQYIENSNSNLLNCQKLVEDISQKYTPLSRNIFLVEDVKEQIAAMQR